MGGWKKEGWMEEKAGLRIAYSNQKLLFQSWVNGKTIPALIFCATSWLLGSNFYSLLLCFGWIFFYCKLFTDVYENWQLSLLLSAQFFTRKGKKSKLGETEFWRQSLTTFFFLNLFCKNLQTYPSSRNLHSFRKLIIYKFLNQFRYLKMLIYNMLKLFLTFLFSEQSVLVEI